MVGRYKRNRNANQNIAMHTFYREYYSAIHEVVVKDTHMSRGTVSVQFPNGGSSNQEVSFPIMGSSFPVESGQPKPGQASWGVYFPQVGDRILLAFDVRGKPYTLGYSNFVFREFDRWDRITEDIGGIGWGQTSGKQLKPGDWSFKSARNSSLYIGQKLSLTSSAISITLDGNPTAPALRIRSNYIQTNYGTNSQIRDGSAMRFMAPGDLEEQPVYDVSTGFAGQEHTNYLRRSSIAIPNGILAVRTSIGDVIDDKTNKLPSAPSLFTPSLSTSLTGLGTRVLRQVFDDATGEVPMWGEVVDNLGNYGMEATTAIGLGWTTPAAKWTILNKDTEITSSATYKLTVGAKSDTLVGAAYSLTAGATMDFKSGGKLTLTAPAIGLASSSISLGASPCNLTCTGALTFTAPSLKLGGPAAVSSLIMADVFGPSYTAAMNALGAIMNGFATSLAGTPLAPLAAGFGTIGVAATTAAGAFEGSKTQVTKAI